MSPYKKSVQYYFRVCDETLILKVYSEDCVLVEEARKNGQEDCHVQGVLEFGLNGWGWIEGERSFREGHSLRLAQAIPEFLNEHGLPPESLT